MTTKQRDLAAQLEEARDRAAAARAEADRALQPALEQVAALEAAAARLEAEVAERKAAHEAQVMASYRRQTFPLSPWRTQFTAAVYDGDLAQAFSVYRSMRAERNRHIAAAEVFGYEPNVGADEPKLFTWLDGALSALDSQDRDEAASAIRAELEAA